MKFRSVILLLVLTPFLVSRGDLEQTDGQKEAHRLLLKYGGFSEVDLNSLEQGNVVAVAPRTGKSDEIALVAAVRMNVPRESVLTYLRAVPRYGHYRQAGVFSARPDLEDLKDLSVDVEDFQELRNCRPDDCEFRIRPSELERLRKEMDWAGSDCRLCLSIFVREMLLERISAYMENGAADFSSLFSASAFLANEVPEFASYLEHYPRSAFAGLEDLLYWSKDDFGTVPLFRLTHRSIYRRPNDVLIATKDIYTSRLFSASLGVTVAIAQPRPGRGGDTYLIYLKRYRVDTPDANLSWLEKTLLRGKLIRDIREDLESQKRKIEGEYYAQPGIAR